MLTGNKQTKQTVSSWLQGMQTDRLSLDGPSTQTNSIWIGSPQTAHFRACALADPTVNTSTVKRTKNARILTLPIGKADASLDRHQSGPAVSPRTDICLYHFS